MLWLELQRDGHVTLTRQLYDQLATRILSNELRAGTRLPSTRQLARETGIARNIVIRVYEQLLDEGYLEARTGSGSFVAKLNLPGLPQRLRSPVAAERSPVAVTEDSDVISFGCGTPDLARFPRATWLRCYRTASFYGDAAKWGYIDPCGDAGLREEVARYVRQVKGLDCSPAQVVITSGTAHGVFLVGLLLRRIRNGALVEDPVAGFIPRVLQQAGHATRFVPVDAHGLRIEALPRRPRAGGVFVSSSHQFPLGGTLPIQRRLALLAYARRHDLVIVEDDYDSEFRFSGAPVSSLFRLDPRRVIHLGTFSKCLAPALRLGYMIVPEDLLSLFRALVAPLHASGSGVAQAALARFLREGHLVRHVLRMKRIYERKMRLLERTLRAAFGEQVTISGNSTGLHLVATFAGVTFDQSTMDRLRRAGVECDTVNEYSFEDPRFAGSLPLGYGNLTAAEIAEGVKRLAAALRAA